MRKSFLLTLPLLVIALSTLAADQDTRCFELRTYYAPAGRLDDLHSRFRVYTMKLFEKHGMQNIGYWVPQENPDNKLIYLLAYPTRAAREKAWQAFFADPQWQEVVKKTEANGKIVAKVETVFLAATDYSPPIAPFVSSDARAFELRTYTAAPGKLGDLNARFRNHTVKLFEKHGIQNIGYWTPLADQAGADNTLLYIVAHKSREDAKKSFEAFGKDPDWIAARKASEEKAGGSLTAPNGVKSVFLKATDYSPMK
ncbi:MAG: NIPSNAP family protein [Verrucomicrobia bacterium]|nr:NIPSNAP family protein [Verrucomicrobiota bacterium]